MRIGDMLVERRVLHPGDLTLALEDQARTGRRLCSLLISRGAIDFDDGARALGEQRNVPCALAKHLANRDVEAAAVIPAALGRASHALPIGRTSGGALIVAVRDPDPALRATLEGAAGCDVALVVTPATPLEQLIAASYGAPDDDFDVELGSVVDAELPLPPKPDVDLLDPDSYRGALSSLDDERVAKDHSQSGVILPPSVANARSRSTLPPVAPKIDATILGLARAPTRDAATDLALGFIAGRWLSAAIFAVRGGELVGYRGHGVNVADVVLAFDAPSTLERAISARKLATAMPRGPGQDTLVRALGNPTAIAAMPVVVANEIVAVLAVGDSIHGPADHAAHDELAQLGESLGAAYDRIRRS